MHSAVQHRSLEVPAPVCTVSLYREFLGFPSLVWMHRGSSNQRLEMLLMVLLALLKATLATLLNFISQEDFIDPIEVNNQQDNLGGLSNANVKRK